jgi:hypothetical protein
MKTACRVHTSDVLKKCIEQINLCSGEVTNVLLLRLFSVLLVHHDPKALAGTRLAAHQGLSLDSRGPPVSAHRLSRYSQVQKDVSAMTRDIEW